MNNIELNIFDKYGIRQIFDNEKEFNEWKNSLTDQEYNNLISLDINPADIPFPKKYLIDKTFLNTSDYIKKVRALANVKNADGWYHLYPRLFNEEFLESDNFYKDLLMMSKADTAQYCLWILGESDFINSPYHDEDLKMLVEAKDTFYEGRENENDLTFVVCDSLATLAGNKDSINSPYHRHDMQMIASTSGDKLEMFGSCPDDSISSLAVNKESLNSRNHIVHMELLLDNYEIGNFLYGVMTDKDFMNDELYSRVINEMIEHKDDLDYVIKLCIYAIGLDKAKFCKYIHQAEEYNNIVSYLYDDEEILAKVKKEVEERMNVINTDSVCSETYYIETEKKCDNNLFVKVKKLLLKK